MAEYPDIIIKPEEYEEYDLSCDIKIDKYHLDEEAVKHPHIVLKWLNLLTQANAVLSKAKEGLTDIQLELYIKGKSGQAEHDLNVKPTEKTIEAWIRQQPEYRDALHKVSKAEQQVAYLNNAKLVLLHRKDMLIKEIELWMAGYFARPHVKAGGKVVDNPDKRKPITTSRKRHGKKTHN